MNGRSFIFLAVGFGLGLSVATWRPLNTDRNQVEILSSPTDWSGAPLMAEVIDKIKQEYVAPISDEQLVDSALSGMVSELDPHSLFLDAEEFREVRITTAGNYAGIGVELNTDENKLAVVSPIMHGPAARAGVLPGDVIVKVNNVDVDSGDLQSALERLRGKEGTAVTVALARPQQSELFELDLIRERIDLQTVEGYLLEPGIAYMQISQFSDTTTKDLIAKYIELEEANETKVTGIVIDLRDNPGGVLDAAVSVSDAFLDEGIIVTADGRSDTSDFRFMAHPGDITGGAKLVVLVNRNSASAAEIVAGALQDHKRAVLIGEVTFGKGSVQTVLPLSDGQAVKLTTSRYYTPSGQSIHGSGIQPDVLVEAVSNEHDAPLESAVSHLKTPRLYSQIR